MAERSKTCRAWGYAPGPPRTRIFSPGRAELLAEQLPATATEAAARRDTQAAALRATIKKLDGQQNAQNRALEDVPDGPAAAAMRARISDRFTELHAQRTQAETQLAALQAPPPQPTPAYSTRSPTPPTSCPACRPRSKHGCSPPST